MVDYQKTYKDEREKRNNIGVDRKTENESSLGELIKRIKPLGIKDSTVFHAKDLLTEKAIRSQLGI